MTSAKIYNQRNNWKIRGHLSLQIYKGSCDWRKQKLKIDWQLSVTRSPWPVALTSYFVQFLIFGGKRGCFSEQKVKKDCCCENGYKTSYILRYRIVSSSHYNIYADNLLSKANKVWQRSIASEGVVVSRIII